MAGSVSQVEAVREKARARKHQAEANLLYFASIQASYRKRASTSDRDSGPAWYYPNKTCALLSMPPATPTLAPVARFFAVAGRSFL